MSGNVFTFPGSSERKPNAAAESLLGETMYGPSRSRKAVQADIDAHIAARKAYAKAVSWEVAIQDGERSAAEIEAARQSTETAYQGMREAARSLLVCMPTDPKGLVDLLMYMEKNFSALPPELHHCRETGQSLAFHLLRTVRLSLREITKYGKYGPTS